MEPPKGPEVFVWGQKGAVMADEREKPEVPEEGRPETPRAVKERDRKVTDNPGEGEHMFRDWALI